MKKFTIAVITALLLLTACNQEDMIVSSDDYNEPVINQQAKDPNWLQLPEMDKAALQKSYTWTKTISGTEAGLMGLAFGYYGPNGYVEAYARIDFPANSWDTNVYGETVDISMKLDDGTVSVTFNPHMTFLNYPVLNMYFYGLDFDQEDVANIKFVYLSPDGSYEDIPEDQLRVIPAYGYIAVVNAQIPHFSRFGFLN